LNLFLDIWKVLTPRQRRWVLGAQAISLVMAFSTVAGIASIAPFFSVLSNPTLVQHNAMLRRLYQMGFSNPESFAVALGLGFMGLVLCANLINILGSFVLIWLASAIGTDLQSMLFGEYLQRPYLFHAQTQSAALFNNIVRETTRTTDQILQNGFALITQMITGLLILVSVMLFNAAIAAVMIVALAGGYVLLYLAVRKRLLRAGEVESQLWIEQTAIVNESLGAIKEILLLRLQDFFQGKFQRSSRSLARASAQTRLISQSPRYIMECVAVVGVVAVALIAARQVGGIGPRLGALSFLAFAAYRLLPTFQQAFAAIVRIRADHAGFAAIAADLREARARTQRSAGADGWSSGRPRYEIRLKDVSFRYERDRPLAIDGVSLRIRARSAVGFIGSNGSGKTTLIDLVAGLLAPESGEIEVDGMSIGEGKGAAWQSCIAYVPQQIFLMDTSIAQNIALGVPAGAIDRKRLLAAAQLAQLDKFIAALPGGFDYPVGERGSRLSGGQRQRLGIARALYGEASVLILDEATSALDGLSEQELMSTISKLRGRYTIVMISHRLSTMRACEMIYELDQGRIVEYGSYFELVNNSETLRRLAAADAESRC
jgi:ABC-type bacteriocin/lantibiotic exporter with double-glycine peptidase domain